MKPGRAITEACREQRCRDYTDALMTRRWGLSVVEGDLLRAWLWWGWFIDRPGGLGYPGLHYGRRVRLLVCPR